MKNYLITLIDKEGNQKKIGCQSENINTAVAYDTIQMQMPFTVVSIEELGVAPDDRLTLFERIILENTPKEYKYIARDKGGRLFIFEDTPQKISRTGIWFGISDFKSLSTFDHIFQNIKWKDKEPYKFR